MPIRIDFEDDRCARTRAWVDGTMSERRSPLSPGAIRRVELGALESVLRSLKRGDPGTPRRILDPAR